MDSFHITISDWAAFSPCRMQREEWLAWAGDEDGGASEANYKPDLPWVSAMLRRRLSPMGRAALWAVGQLSDNQRSEPTATIFASRHGDVGRTVKLLRELAVQAPLSPASFSLSVHNAIGGIHSIASKVYTPVTAISAGPDTICAALLEAYTQLVSSSEAGGDVLCVFYDDPLPAPLVEFDREVSDVQALAVRLSLTKDASTGIPLAFSLTEAPNSEEQSAGKSLAHADRFLRFLLRGDSDALDLTADRRLWHWRKCDRQAS